jgi:hypothetical protein
MGYRKERAEWERLRNSPTLLWPGPEPDTRSERARRLGHSLVGIARYAGGTALSFLGISMGIASVAGGPLGFAGVGLGLALVELGRRTQGKHSGTERICQEMCGDNQPGWATKYSLYMGAKMAEYSCAGIFLRGAGVLFGMSSLGLSSAGLLAEAATGVVGGAALVTGIGALSVHEIREKITQINLGSRTSQLRSGSIETTATPA